jgi:protein-S-isoprenylcysteine O-methyltransferase Ste14
LTRAIKSALATIFVTGVVCFLIPYLILDRLRIALSPPQDLYQILALLAGGLGLFMVVWVSAAFVRRGEGTPIPLEPPTHLVVAGLYRYVRNPMYAVAVLIVLAEALYFRSTWLVLYAGVLWAILHTALVTWEEPQLKRRFGIEYEQYLREVPRWIPRLNPR